MTPAAQAQFARGVAALQRGEPLLAEQAFHATLHQAPDCAEALANLAWLAERRGDFALALGHYRQALALNRQQGLPAGQIGLNTAVCLLRLKQLDEACRLARQGVAEQPENPQAWSNLGAILASAQDDAAAETACRQALALQADYAPAHLNLAYVLLRQGRDEAGWRALAGRALPADYAAFFACPRWAGEPLQGRSLVIAPEFGAGDLIQFCRFIPRLKVRGARRVTLICPPALVALMQTLDGVDAVLGIDAPLADECFDYWSLPLDLPGHGLGEPISPPYLYADPLRCAHWQTRLPAGALRVGLVWRGNPRHENDADRSIDPALLAPLADVAGIRWLNLQVPPQALPGALGAGDLQAPFVDYADTAAVLANIDLLISVDTAPAHLAGALGRPCWVLLPDYRCDWRWQKAGERTPWYGENFRLFRQGRQGEWPAVIEAVKTALIALSNSYDALH